MNKILSEKEINQQERMKFVHFWAEYVRTHPDKDWGEQQAVLIDSQLQNNIVLTREQYLYIIDKGKRKN